MRTGMGKAVAYGALAITLGACATAGSVLSGAMGGVNRGAGQAAGNAAAGAVAAQPAGAPGAPGMGYGPQMMTYYANWMFALGFNSGGYWLPGADLRQGQSVTFEFNQSDNTQRMERAYLKQLPDGKQWWRVMWYKVGSQADTVVFEAMFSADRSQVLRMRGRSPGQQAGEIPVEQNAGFSWREPTYLTQESLDAATVGTETVTTAAGAFTAKHVKYALMGGGTYEWWMAGSVPGGVVKYVVSYGNDNYTQTLVAMSSNATTMLGSY